MRAGGAAGVVAFPVVALSECSEGWATGAAYIENMRQPIRVDNSRAVTVCYTARTLGVSKKRTEAIIREVERTAGRVRNGSEVRFERLAEVPKIDLHPIMPSLEVLAEKADFINRTLREASVKDEYRPACVGAIMLAMWESKGSLRRDPADVLTDVNLHCEHAFRIGGKSGLAKSLRVDPANKRLARSAWKIISTLEKLNVVGAAFAHDYLGHLYETFFRYTGGNTIGQYFTPRHIARFMADICEVTKKDLVIDPACGTGGFLIASMQRVFDVTHPKLRYEDAVDIVRDKLIGYESEPVTAALCVANMLLRGDGKTGIRKDSCFTAKDYPEGRCDVALMNPPFPHKKTDTPPQRFVERALDALKTRGRLAVILPTSLLVKRSIGGWREKILKENTLLSAVKLPDELFQPYASADTSVVMLEKGVPHKGKETVFGRVHYDGLTLKKGNRVLRGDGRNDLDNVAQAILNHAGVPGMTGVGVVKGATEWSPGAYIDSALPVEDELKGGADELLRRLASFYVRYAAEVGRLRKRVAADEFSCREYRGMISKGRLENARSLPRAVGTIGEFFEIFYGQKELHSREGYASGDALIISPTEQYNGCYGWLEFKDLIKAPCITVAQTGSIGEAFVQLEPCGVNDDCLLLLPRHPALPLACYFIAAAIIRLEKWRFSYGRKLTPSRICNFAMTRLPTLEGWVEDSLRHWKSLTEEAVQRYLAPTSAADLGRVTLAPALPN
jgi:type I restriction enzyme M protein